MMEDLVDIKAKTQYYSQLQPDRKQDENVMSSFVWEEDKLIKQKADQIAKLNMTK